MPALDDAAAQRRSDLVRVGSGNASSAFQDRARIPGKLEDEPGGAPPSPPGIPGALVHNQNRKVSTQVSGSFDESSEASLGWIA